MRVLLIAVAGAAGALARHAVSTVLNPRAAGGFPLGTLTVNITGSFLLALVVTAVAERIAPDTALRTAITVGFLGAYTTFSTFALETVRLAEDGAAPVAGLYLAASVVGGVLAVLAGTWVGKAV